MSEENKPEAPHTEPVYTPEIESAIPILGGFHAVTPGHPSKPRKHGLGLHAANRPRIAASTISCTANPARLWERNQALS